LADFLSNEEIWNTWKKVAVIGAKVWEEMFDKVNTIGERSGLERKGSTIYRGHGRAGSAFGDFSRDEENTSTFNDSSRRLSAQ